MVTAVMAEAVLHRGVGGPKVMHEQLTYLAEAGQKPNVSIQVIPAESGAHAGLEGAVSIAEQRRRSHYRLPGIAHRRRGPTEGTQIVARGAPDYRHAAL